MTNANMKLVMVDVPFKNELVTSDQKLDSGEFITRRIVELSKLSEEFKSASVLFALSSGYDIYSHPQYTEYEEKVNRV
jgi:hypothetical protein